MNNNEIENTSPTEKETGINRQFFEELIENSSLSQEDKKKIGEFKDFKNDTVGEVLKTEDKDKLRVYDNLEEKGCPEKGLPSDWKLKLARVKKLEEDAADYLAKKEELKGWVEVFGEKKPEEVQGEIKKLEESKEKVETELKEKVSELEKNLEKVNLEKDNIAARLQGRVFDLEKKLEGWNGFFEGKELTEVKEELEELRERPDIAISTEEFYEDYARRKWLKQSDLDRKELEQEKNKVAELTKEKERFLKAVNHILENMRTRNYVLAKPVISEEQAQEAIAELLEENLNKWGGYLRGEVLIERDLDFELSIYPEKKERVKQVLEWIKETKENKDYQKLFELWNGDKVYNKENDFGDGSLSLLKKYLDVRDPEPIL